MVPWVVDTRMRFDVRNFDRVAGSGTTTDETKLRIWSSLAAIFQRFSIPSLSKESTKFVS